MLEMYHQILAFGRRPLLRLVNAEDELLSVNICLSPAPSGWIAQLILLALFVLPLVEDADFFRSVIRTGIGFGRHRHPAVGLHLEAAIEDLQLRLDYDVGLGGRYKVLAVHVQQHLLVVSGLPNHETLHSCYFQHAWLIHPALELDVVVEFIERQYLGLRFSSVVVDMLPELPEREQFCAELAKEFLGALVFPDVELALLDGGETSEEGLAVG